MGVLPQVFAVAFVAMLALATPLRMALGWTKADGAGLSAARVEGTLWRGTLSGAAFRGLPLGDARAGVRLPDLLIGRPALGLVADGVVQGRGVVRLTSGGLAVDRVEASLPLRAVAPAAPLQGRLALSGFRAEFRGGACRAAGGKVALEAPQLAGGPPLPGLALSGAPACREGLLTLPLAGQAQGVAVEAVIRIDAAGRYRMETLLRATDPRVAALAGAAGFERGLDGFARTDEGRLTD